jgi:hypothetical protein
VDAAAEARGEKGQSHRQAALQNYRQAVDILLQLKSQNAFAEVDEKSLEEMQAIVEKMSEK